MDFTARLPPELWLRIIEFLDTNDIRALSGVCSSISSWLAKRLFSSLRISNESQNLEAMGSFLERHGDIVTKVCYESYLHPRKCDSEDGVLVLPEILQDLLAGHGVPNLETIELSFLARDNFNGLYDGQDSWSAPNPEYYDDEGQSIYMHQVPETTQQIHRAESTFQWRADIQGAFDAIVQNTTLKRLEISNLIPRECSTWRTKKWKTFLNAVPCLKLRIWGGDNGVGWHSTTMEGYGDFIAKLQPQFFKHLINLTELHLISEEHNVLGCEGAMNHSLLPIKPEDLPRLAALELENWLIDSALIGLVSARKSTLHTLKLTNCKAAVTRHIAINSISWAEFFRAVRNVQSVKLTSFTVFNESILLDYWENRDEKDQSKHGYTGDRRAKVEGVRKILQENSKLRLFEYGFLDDKYGDYMSQDEEIMESFEAGKDQKEYDLLMERINENASRPSE